MTKDEIRKIAKIMLTADNWCGSCSSALLEDMREAFPQHADAIKAVEEKAATIEQRFRVAVDAWDYGPEEKRPRVWLT